MPYFRKLKRLGQTQFEGMQIFLSRNLHFILGQGMPSLALVANPDIVKPIQRVIHGHRGRYPLATETPANGMNAQDLNQAQIAGAGIDAIPTREVVGQG